MNNSIKSLGEFGLIKRLARKIKTDATVVTGIGDDAAVIKRGGGYMLFTADMLVEDVHFLKTAGPAKIGWKAVCCSVSDIAAMGGVPRWMTVSLGLAKSTSVRFVEELYKGIRKAASLCGVNIVGGDTVRAEKLVLDISMIGETSHRPILRSGAKTGDAIYVTGALGGAVKSGRHLTFMPRLAQAQYLVKNFTINSMIDISDGLSSDLRHILEKSNAGAAIEEGRLPLSKGADVESALSEGEDFELLFTLAQAEAKRLPKKIKGVKLTRIGRIVKKGTGAFFKQTGYRHF